MRESRPGLDEVAQRPEGIRPSARQLPRKRKRAVGFRAEGGWVGARREPQGGWDGWRPARCRARPRRWPRLERCAEEWTFSGARAVGHERDRGRQLQRPTFSSAPSRRSASPLSSAHFPAFLLPAFGSG